MTGPSQSSGRAPRPTRVCARGSLESRALLDGPREEYVCTLYPEAGEASIVRRTHPEKATQRRPALDPDELEREREEAAVRRARSKVRRYTRANRCRYLWTLTFRAAVRDYGEACTSFDGFLRRLREKYGRIPLVAVPEPQQAGHAWHWHFGSQRKLSI